MPGQPPSIHLVPYKGGWALRGQGKSKPSKTFKTKAAALEVGRARARKAGAELFVHKANGRIEVRHSYGNDPVRRPG